MIAKTKLGRIFSGALIAFVFIGILGVSLIHPILANGDDHDDDDEYDDDEERSIEISFEEDGVEVDVVGDNGGYELELEGNEPSFELEYKTEDGTTETETEFDVKFESLIEYNELTGNGFYDEGDEEVQVLYLEGDEEEEDDEESSGAVHWLPPTLENLTLETGPVIYKLTLASDPSLSNGLDMQIVVYCTVESGVIPDTGTRVDNFTIKIDIIIASFPWIGGDQTNLALKVEVETEHETEEEEHEDDEDEHEVSSKLDSDYLSGGAAEIYFAWKDTAIINENFTTDDTEGKEVLVNSTKLVKNDDEGEETEEKIYLCYPHFTTLIHDPTLGINYVSGHKTMVISAVIAVVVVMAAAAIVLVKRH